jgi:hypothetical protein
MLRYGIPVNWGLTVIGCYGKCINKNKLLVLVQQADFRDDGPPAKPGESISAKEISDPCAESATMTYLGGLLFAMGDDQQGLAWTKEAYRKSEGLAELRGACKERAIVAGKNVARMLEIMKEKKGSAPASRSGWFWLGTEKPVEQDESIEE